MSSGALPQIPEKTKRGRSLSLTPAATVLYLLTFLLALYQLDRQNYQNAKKQIITRNSPELLGQPGDLPDIARRALYGPSDAKKAAAADMQDRMRQIVQGPQIYYKFELLDRYGNTVVSYSDPEKPARYRNWGNTLFLPSFSSTVDVAIVNPDASQRTSDPRDYGRLTGLYTNPVNYDLITELTANYRLYATALAAVWALGYAFLYFRILRPMRRVTAHLADSRDTPPRLIEHPMVLLEANYNQMAAQALLQTLGERLTALLRSAGTSSSVARGEVVEDALASVRRWFAVRDLVAAEVSTAHGDLKVTEVFGSHSKKTPSAEAVTTGAAKLLGDGARGTGGQSARESADGSNSANATDGDFWVQDAGDADAGPAAAEPSTFEVDGDGKFAFSGRLGPGTWLVAFGQIENVVQRRKRTTSEPAVDQPKDKRSTTHLAEIDDSSAGWLTPGAGSDVRTRTDAVKSACVALRRALIAHRSLQQDVFRQKSEANIVLSRNLGHDLTNIIATTKLDLMAVRRLLTASGVATAGATPQGAELLQQSVHGLLESTKFLQEIVNIYRSFSNVKRPQYERRDLNALVEEFLHAFEPSVSSRVEIRRDFEEQMPSPIVEPRLIKLALFNVITNAFDAHKRATRTAGEGPPPRPVVTVRTRFDAHRQMYRISIDDNGPGIRDPQGRLLAPAEIDSIFRLGYSTKESEASEGLGLSWVRTIVEQFHDGRVGAENLPDGGARITLGLRSMESAEAKVPA